MRAKTIQALGRAAAQNTYLRPLSRTPAATSVLLNNAHLSSPAPPRNIHHSRTLHTSKPHLDFTSAKTSPSSNVNSDLDTLASDLQSAETTTLETITLTDLPASHLGSIRILSLNRPRARNAISKQLLKELDESVEAIHAQGPAGNVRVLVLASDVDESFCAGADLKERKTMSQDEVTTFLAHLRSTFRRLAQLPIPSISAISGTALGGGLELALTTHLRVLSSNAILGLPETRLGIIPGAGGTYRLPAVVGTARALEMMLTGRRISAAEAVGMGLGDAAWGSENEAEEERVLDPTRKRLLVLARAVSVARMISQGGPLALEAVLRAVTGAGGPSEVAENVAYDSILHTEDRMEALKAFAEKRAVQFKGR